MLAPEESSYFESRKNFDLRRSSSTSRMQNPFEDLINLYQIKLVDIVLFILGCQKLRTQIGVGQALGFSKPTLLHGC